MTDGKGRIKKLQQRVAKELSAEDEVEDHLNELRNKWRDGILFAYFNNSWFIWRVSGIQHCRGK